MADALETVARKLGERPKGILAADESPGTIGNRFREVGLEATPDNVRDFREAILTTSGLEAYISGVILHPDTLGQTTGDGTTLVSRLVAHGIIPIVKVDQGPQPHSQYPGEFLIRGLDGLSERLDTYAGQGAMATKWRAVFNIGNGRPSDAIIGQNVELLKQFAYLSLQRGMVPMVEPEVEMTGPHGIQECYDASSGVLAALFETLDRSMLNKVILKTNMIVPGNKYAGQIDLIEATRLTLEVFQKYVPPNVAAIALLSGGVGDEDSTLILNYMNQRHTQGRNQTPITFSFSRALLRAPYEAFARERNPLAVQQALLNRAEANSLATTGSYRPK